MTDDARPTLSRRDDPAPPTPTPARARARRTPAWLRRLRYSFSLESLRELGTTLALVVPLTVLIWVWAEREQTREYKPILQVGVHALNPSRVMSVATDNGRNDPVNVSVTLVGPKAGIDGLAELLNRDPAGARLTLEVPDDIEPRGTHDVNVLPLLDDERLFRRFGVTVKSVEPGVVKVRSDALVTRDLKVTFPDDVAGRVASITADPATVKVRGPETAIAEMQAAGTLRADVDLSSVLHGERAAPGKERTFDSLPLLSIDRPNVTFEPPVLPHVTVRFADAEQDVLRGVTVYVSQPAALGATLETSPATIDVVKIAGPRDLLNKVMQTDDPSLKPYAIVRIVRSDVGKTVSRVPQVQVPPGITVVDPTSIPPVSVKVADPNNPDAPPQ